MSDERTSAEAPMQGRYRLGKHYGIHVYEGDRPVATFHDPTDAAMFVAAANDTYRETS